MWSSRARLTTHSRAAALAFEFGRQSLVVSMEKLLGPRRSWPSGENFRRFALAKAFSISTVVARARTSNRLQTGLSGNSPLHSPSLGPQLHQNRK
jgi:hypothetical protein